MKTRKTKNPLLAPIAFATLASCQSSAAAEPSRGAESLVASDDSALAAGDQAASGHVLTAKVSGLRNTNGGVLAFLHASEDTFPKKFKQAAHRIHNRSLQSSSASLRFRGVQPGTYALVVIHDENGNGTLDKSLIGFPKEGIGASNVVKGRPSWSSAKFTVDDDMSVSVSMQYFGGD